ncbi:hypothetical protein D9M70_492660 [compost metagenome]
MPDVFTAGLLDEVGLAGVEISIQRQQLVRLRMTRNNGMRFQFAESRGEVLLFHRSDVLVAEEQHFVLEPQRPDFRDHVRVLGRVSQTDVAEVGADGGRAEFDLDRMLAHRWPDQGRCRGRGLRGAVLDCHCSLHSLVEPGRAICASVR